ncbi:hypothetical protein [Methanopyrus sp.]
MHIAQFAFTVLAAYPPFVFPKANDIFYAISFMIIMILVLVRIRKSLPKDLKIIWVTYIVAVIIIGVIFGRFIGRRSLFIAPLLTVSTLGLAAMDGCLPALGVLIGYCILTTDWWYFYAYPAYPTDVLERYWELFYKSFIGNETVVAMSGLLPFTSTWKPQEVARVVRTFPEPGLPVIVAGRRGDTILRFLLLTGTKTEYIVAKLPPTEFVWSVDDRAGSFRRNVLIEAERYGPRILMHIMIMNYGGVPTVLTIVGKVRRGLMIFSGRCILTEPADLSTYSRTRHIPNGYLVQVSDWQGVRIVKVAICEATWVDGKLVFRGSLRDLVASVRVAGDLV